jgi:hypothetical protein
MVGLAFENLIRSAEFPSPCPIHFSPGMQGAESLLPLCSVGFTISRPDQLGGSDWVRIDPASCRPLLLPIVREWVGSGAVPLAKVVIVLLARPHLGSWDSSSRSRRSSCSIRSR